MKRLKGSNQYVTRISRRTRVAKRINLIRLYIALAITLGVFFYIVARGTVDLMQDIFKFSVEAPTHKVYAKEIVTPTPTPTEREEIDAYIKEVFGKDSDKAFLLLTCENSTHNPDAVNTAGNFPVGSRDIGVFMINEHWQATQGKFLFNWKINVQIAKQLFDENDGQFNLWTCGRKLGI